MEVSALKTPVVLRGPTPFLRLQSDERLVEMTRRGNQSAYEALVARYQSRLQSFCRHMLGSKEDAEDVLQEVFAAAFGAMTADDRPLNVRPWLYRIARNRSLNHLRRQRAVGVDSMDVHFAEGGITTADKVQRREDLRLLVSDVQDLAETQRTALLLREIDALSYDQIAEAMETTVPAIKSLLVRARVSLAEAAEARALTCEEVRDELGEVAEGLRRMSPPVRRHLKSCDRCSSFNGHLRANNKALAAIFPVAPLLLLKKLVLAHVGGAGNAATASGASASAGAAAATGGSMAAGGALSAGVSAVTSKAVAGIAAVAIVGAGAVEVQHVRHNVRHGSTVAAVAPVHHAPPVSPPLIRKLARQPSVAPAVHHAAVVHHLRHHHVTHKTEPTATTPDIPTTTAAVVPTTIATTTPAVTAPPTPTPAPPQTESDATDLPGGSSGTGDGSGSTTPITVTTPPVETTPPAETTPPPVPVETTPAPPPVETTPPVNTTPPPVDTTPPPVDTTPVPPPPDPPAPTPPTP